MLFKSALLLGLVCLTTAASVNPGPDPIAKSPETADVSARTSASGASDLIGGLIDHLTCTRTTNRGLKGRCVPRSCCSRAFGVDELCTDPQYTCCYGNRCTELNEFDEVSNEIYPDFPGEDYDSFADRGGRCGRNHVRRQEWDAEPTAERLRRINRRLETVIVHHTGDGERACWNFEECRRYLRYTQRNYQQRKAFPDIPWNFLISENGEVFEGMGWGVEGYHTEAWNDRSLGVAFIGNYEEQTPTRRAMEAFSQLLDCGVRSGQLDSYYGIYGHRDLRRTECPGEYLYEAIRHMKAFRQYAGGKKIFTNLIELADRSAGGSPSNATVYSA